MHQKRPDLNLYQFWIKARSNALAAIHARAWLKKDGLLKLDKMGGCQGGGRGVQRGVKGGVRGCREDGLWLRTPSVRAS